VNKLIKIAIPILLILILVLTAGCAAKQATVPPPEPPASSGVVKEYIYGGESRAVPEESNQAETDRRLVKTGYLLMVL